MANNQLTRKPVTEEELTAIFHRIALLASVVSTTALDMVIEADPHTINQPQSIRLLCQQMGWLADLGAEKVAGRNGAGVAFGDAEAWMLRESCSGVPA